MLPWTYETSTSAVRRWRETELDNVDCHSLDRDRFGLSLSKASLVLPMIKPGRKNTVVICYLPPAHRRGAIEKKGQHKAGPV
jgi:hypothetical protein